MAEIQTNQSSTNNTSKRTIRSTKVDLTPMVDLGFLLITFFIFTTALSKPTVMNLVLPNESSVTNPNQVGEEKVITIIPKANHTLAYYFGNQIEQMQETHWGENGIRKVLLNKKQLIAQKFGNAKDFVVLIKPTEQSTYQNLIDIFDEMHINDIKRYMLLDITQQELSYVKNNTVN